MGELLSLGQDGQCFTGPSEEKCDLILLVKQRSASDFIAFSSNEDYLAGMGHRLAAILDSLLLPMIEAT